MTQPTFDLRRVLLVLRTRKRLWIPLGLGVILAVNLLTFVLPKKYESVAKVRVYEPRARIISDQADDILTVEDRLETVSEEITSYNFLEEIAAKPPVNLTGSLNPNGREYEKVVMRLSREVKVYTGDDLFEIHYKASDPRQAYQVVNEILDEYLARTANFYGRRTRRTVELTTEQLQQAQTELGRVQDAIKAYKEAHPNEIPEAAQANMAHLSSLRATRQQNFELLEAERDAVQLARAKLASMPGEINTRTTVEKNTELLGIRSEIRMLEVQLEQKLKDFQEEHPDVIALRDQIEVLQRHLAELEEDPIEEIETAPNPQYQALLEQIDQSDMAIRRMETQIAQQDEEIRRLEDYMRQLPLREQELSELESQRQMAEQLVRDYSDTLNEARRVADLDVYGQGPSFEVIDRPRQPTRPVSPNHVKYGALSFFLALFAVGLLVYMLALLDPVVRTMEDAREILRMPLLGIVQSLGEDGVAAAPEIRRSPFRLRKIAALLFVMLGLGAALLVLAFFVSTAPGHEQVAHFFGGM